MVEPVEAQNKDQCWFINYGKDHQGLIKTLHKNEIEAHYFSLHSALMNTFANDNYAILILEGHMMALIRWLDCTFYLFDPHARNANGMPHPNGTAVVVKYDDLSELEHYLYSLSSELNSNLFEVVPVQLRLGYNAKEHMRQIRSEESECDKQNRLENARKYEKRKRDGETETERQARLKKAKNYKKRKQAVETECERFTRLEKDTNYQKAKQTKKACVENETRLTNAKENPVNQQVYLKEYDIAKHGSIEEQCWAKANINKFHKSIEFSISQCKICQEAWPLKSKPRSPSDYVCSRCSRDKKSPKKFSLENSMIPSYVPHELQNMTQIEEMLIACALPIMRVYIKPGGQRGYSGHCINLPQNVKELATSLPRYPKELAVIIVKVKGKDNTFKDVSVRRNKVHNALLWLIHNNPHYAQLEIDVDALNSLPENGVLPDLTTVETEDEMVSDDSAMPDLGPPTDNPSEDIVYNNSTEMRSFLPVGEQQQQELEAVRNQVSANEPMT